MEKFWSRNSLQKQLVAAKRKGNCAVRPDQCCRSRVFDKHGRRFLISTEGGCVAVILPLGLLGNRHAESLGIRKASGQVS